MTALRAHIAGRPGHRLVIGIAFALVAGATASPTARAAAPIDSRTDPGTDSRADSGNATARATAAASPSHRPLPPGVEWVLTQTRDPDALLTPGERAFDSAAWPDQSVLRLTYTTEVSLTAREVHERVRWVDYYRTRDGAQQYPSDSIGWDAGAERLTVRTAAVVTGDGRVYHFDPATVQVNDTDSLDVFTDYHDLVLALPGLEADAWTVIEFDRVTARTPDAVPWQRIDYLAGGIPNLDVRHVVRWQTDGPGVRWNQHGDLLDCFEETRPDGSHELRCRNREPIPAAWVADETNYFDRLPRLVMGEALEWDDVIAWNARGLADATRNDAPVAAEWTRLVGGIDDAETRIHRLHEFVARDIRYHSASEGVHAFVPHSAEETLERRYGDCKDKSTLLWALLRRSGVDAYPVLVSTEREAPEALRVPGFGWFDHMIVCWDTPDRPGGRRCLDPTDSWTSAAHTPAWIQGRVGLPLVRGGTPVALPADTTRWRMAVAGTMRFEADGDQLETLEVEWIGPWAGSHRSHLGASNDADRRRWAVDVYRSIVAEDAEPEVGLGGVDAPADTLTVHYRTRFERAVPADTDLDYTEPPSWPEDILSNFRAANERYPYPFPGAELVQTWRIETDGHWHLDPGNARTDLVHPFGTLTQHTEPDGDAVLVTTRLHLPARVIAADELPLFVDLLDLYARESRVRVRGTRVAPDS